MYFPDFLRRTRKSPQCSLCRPTSNPSSSRVGKVSRSKYHPPPGSLARRQFALDGAAASGKPFWAPPIWVTEASGPVLTYIAPVTRGDDLIGVVVAPVVLSRIAEFLLELETENNLSAFILHDHDRVLSHPRMKDTDFKITTYAAGNPLPRIQDIPEPAFDLLAGGRRRSHNAFQLCRKCQRCTRQCFNDHHHP